MTSKQARWEMLREIAAALAGDDDLDRLRQANRLLQPRRDGGRILFDVERHPPLIGMVTRGIPSPGYITVLQTWATREGAAGVELVAERYCGLEVDNLGLLVEEAVMLTAEAYEEEICNQVDEEGLSAWLEGVTANIAQFEREGLRDPPYFVVEHLSAEDTERLQVDWDRYVDDRAERLVADFRMAALKMWADKLGEHPNAQPKVR